MDNWEGIATIIVVWTLREVLGAVKSKKNGNGKTTKQVDDLWRWHAKEDIDGRKLWYSHPDERELLKALTENLAKLELEIALIKEMMK